MPSRSRKVSHRRSRKTSKRKIFSKIKSSLSKLSKKQVLGLAAAGVAVATGAYALSRKTNNVHVKAKKTTIKDKGTNILNKMYKDYIEPGVTKVNNISTGIRLLEALGEATNKVAARNK